MTSPSNSRYDPTLVHTIEDARRGTTTGLVPRRTLIPSTTWSFRLVTPGWFIENTAHYTQGSMYAWWRIMDTNPEYMHPWDIVSGDLVRLPTLK